MMKSFLTIGMSALSICVLAQTTNIDIPFGQLTYKTDSKTNESILLGSKVNYKLYKIGLELDSQNKLSDNKFTYNDKNFSLLMNKGNYYYDSKNLKISYLSNNIKDYWGRNINGINSIIVYNSNFLIKSMDCYNEYQFNFNNISFKKIQSFDRNELAFGFNEKNKKFNVIYSPILDKNLISFESLNLNFKSILDNGVHYETLKTKNYILAFGPDQSFVDYKIKENIEIKYSHNDTSDDYTLKYYNLGIQNDHLFLVLPFKKIIFQLQDNADINAVNYNDVYKKTKINIKYSNKFNINDFYLNQALFDIYYNNYALVNKTQIVNNNALNVNLDNSILNLKTDIVNDIYNVSLKFKDINLGFFKDQNNKKITLTDNNKNGSYGLSYDILNTKFITFNIDYKFKF